MILVLSNTVYSISQDDIKLTFITPNSAEYGGQLIMIYEDAYGDISDHLTTLDLAVKLYPSFTKELIEIFVALVKSIKQ